MSERSRSNRGSVDNSGTVRTLRLNLLIVDANIYLGLNPDIPGVEVQVAGEAGTFYQEGKDTKSVLPGNQLLEISGTDAAISALMARVVEGQYPIKPPRVGRRRNT